MNSHLTFPEGKEKFVCNKYHSKTYPLLERRKTENRKLVAQAQSREFEN